LIAKTIEIRVHKTYLTKFNKAVQYRQFYGIDFYSSDSDVVCILQHQGKINLTDREPTEYEGIAVYFKVMKTRAAYNSQYRNGIKSLKKKTYEGNCIKFEGSELLREFGSEKDLKEMADIMPNRIENIPSTRKMIKQN
jgi:hypothetical protein